MHQALRADGSCLANLPRCFHDLRMTDTSPAAHALQMRLYALMPSSRRVQQAVARSAALRQMVWQRVKEAHPAASPAQLRRAFAERWLGPELAERVYGQTIE